MFPIPFRQKSLTFQTLPFVLYTCTLFSSSIPPPLPLTRSHTHTHTTRTHARTHARTHTRTNTHTHTHIHARTHARTQHTQRRDGVEVPSRVLPQKIYSFPASPTPHPPPPSQKKCLSFPACGSCRCQRKVSCWSTLLLGS